MNKKHKVDLLNNSENSKNSMKNTIALLSILVLFGTIGTAYAELSISSEVTDGTDYGYNQVITTISNVNGTEIDFKVQSFNGTNIVDIETMATDVFAWNHIKYHPSGTYTVLVTDDVSTATSTFYWINPDTESAPVVDPTVITVEVDKTQYTTGDIITIKGTVSPIVVTHNDDTIVELTFAHGEKIDRSNMHVKVDQSTGEFIYKTPKLELEYEHMGTVTAYVTYLDKTVETDFDLVEWKPTYKTKPIVEPTPEPIVEPSTDLEERVIQLEAENQLLKEKIEKLNRLVLEQLKIIVDWINN